MRAAETNAKPISKKEIFAGNIRMAHRVLGIIFVVVPLISAIAAPKGVAHIAKNLFHSWDSDDKKWMALFAR